jgi:HK97 gp10 family phage protein
MADGFEISVTGLDKVDKALQQLSGGEFREKMMRSALRAGGTVMQAAIMANAPINPKMPGPKSTALPPGALQSDVHLTVSKDKQTDSFSAWIYFGKYTIHVARFVEWGHLQIHGGRKGKGITIKTTSGDGNDVAAHPFIRPAFDANIDLVAQAINDSIKADLASGKLGA